MTLRRENEEVLLSLGYVSGRELTQRRVDFNLVFPTEASRLEGKAIATALGFDWIDCDEGIEPGTFEATAIKVLSPDADAISESEIALTEGLCPFGADIDGWGFFGDTIH